MAQEIKFFDSSTFEENREYLNWPGLQYLWYSKLKPAIYRSSSTTIKERIDDENWYITYDASTGEVYISYTEDNKAFYVDQDGSCGSVEDFNGMLHVVVDTEHSNMIDGFIDDHFGAIGSNHMHDDVNPENETTNTSDKIGCATGKLYVNFERGYEYERPSEIEDYGT